MHKPTVLWASVKKHATTTKDFVITSTNVIVKGNNNKNNNTVTENAHCELDVARNKLCLSNNFICPSSLASILRFSDCVTLFFMLKIYVINYVML